MEANNNLKKEIRPFGTSDRIGYMLGDLGNDFSFILASSFMMKFYTDVMGIEGAVVGSIMMIVRIAGAFTDVAMGQIVDRSRPREDGKFRPWIKWMCGPVAISSFLIYQSGLAGMSYGFKVAWLLVTYVLWGSIFYTMINIPYGAMVSAVSPDPKERASLSTWRNIGAVLANLVIGTGTPLFAYVVVNGHTVLSGPRMTLIAGIFSILSFVCYILCLYLTPERVVVQANQEAFHLGTLVKKIATNRSLLGIILAALLLMLSVLSLGGMSAYVFPNYYGNVTAQSAASLVGSVGMLLICAPLSERFAASIGKKELSMIGCGFSIAVLLALYVIRPGNPYVYVAFFALSQIGYGFFNSVIWAMITDVIDASELKHGVREDGTIYAVFSFARKMGQAASSGLIGFLLTTIGYTAATAYDTDVVNGIYDISCLLPAFGLILVVLALAFVYPLGKKMVEENTERLHKG